MQKVVKDSPYNFGKNHRLCLQRDFSRVFESPSGKVRLSPWVVLFMETELSSSRLGIVIKKSLVKRAVDRNDIRRVLRESFRLRSKRRSDESVENTPHRCFDVVVMVDRSILIAVPQLKERAEMLWQQFIVP